MGHNFKSCGTSDWADPVGEWLIIWFFCKNRIYKKPDFKCLWRACDLRLMTICFKFLIWQKKYIKNKNLSFILYGAKSRSCAEDTMMKLLYSCVDKCVQGRRKRKITWKADGFLYCFVDWCSTELYRYLTVTACLPCLQTFYMLFCIGNVSCQFFV